MSVFKCSGPIRGEWPRRGRCREATGNTILCIALYNIILVVVHIIYTRTRSAVTLLCGADRVRDDRREIERHRSRVRHRSPRRTPHVCGSSKIRTRTRRHFIRDRISRCSGRFGGINCVRERALQRTVIMTTTIVTIIIITTVTPIRHGDRPRYCGDRRDFSLYEILIFLQTSAGWNV